MKLIKAQVKNFASYKDLEFNFDSNHLTLVSGPTGSGKSTLCDVVPWILFGKTSKGGSVDEIRSWTADAATEGTLEVDGHTIFRSRKPNDLTIDGRRGKDLQDTQKLINSTLGLDYELYLASAYMHEFSQTAQFFTTSAKNRRALTEQLMDLSLAKSLALKAKEEEKALTLIKNELDRRLNKALTQLEMLKSMSKDAGAKIREWRHNNRTQVKSAIDSYRHFCQLKDNEKSLLHGEIQAIEDKLQRLIPHLEEAHKCETCGHVLNNDYMTQYEDLDRSMGERLQAVERIEYQAAARHDQVTRNVNMLRSNENPFLKTIDTAQMQALETKVQTIADEYDKTTGKLLELTLLQDIIPQFRNILITDTISFLETKTNEIISDHFDGELSIELKVEADDKLEVEIKKDGNSCAYTQLSKGQRQILKLAFCTSVMTSVQNHSGVQVDTLFFDEALDGLDDSMKLKAFTLLEKLALNHANVFVVEHSEGLKSMFSNKITVSNQGGRSVLE